MAVVVVLVVLVLVKDGVGEGIGIDIGREWKAGIGERGRRTGGGLLKESYARGSGVWGLRANHRIAFINPKFENGNSH